MFKKYKLGTVHFIDQSGQDREERVLFRIADGGVYLSLNASLKEDCYFIPAHKVHRIFIS